MVTLALGDGRSQKTPVKRDAQWWVDTIDTSAVIDTIRAAWTDLAWHTVEPNPFYEHWMVKPGWDCYAKEVDLRLVCVWRSGARPQDPPELCGLIPLSRRRHDKLPVTGWSLWHNDYICNCTPLLRQGVATQAWSTFLDWLQQQSLPLLELPLVTADGPFQHALLEVANDRLTPISADFQYSRALLRPAESADAYCAETMTCHNRQELRRQRRRLSEQGVLESRVWQPGDDVQPWVDEFLRLEGAGWKGREGTSFNASSDDANYLRQVIQSAAETHQVVLLGLFLNDQAIALKLNFLSGEAGFTFKIAFDEDYKKYSPGVQLELENIEWFHRQRGLKWLDSCARPDHFMIGRLWRDRRLMQRLTMSTGSRWGDLLVGGLSLARSIKAALRPRRVVDTETDPPSTIAFSASQETSQ